MNKIKVFFISILLISCADNSPEISKDTKLNVLFIVADDLNTRIGAYGDNQAITPNIDKLAKNGVLYTNAFMPSPVCSPTRSTIITGVMATTLGLHNHHSSRTPESEIKLPKEFKTIPEIFKK